MGRGMVWFSVFGTVEEDHMWLSRVPPSSARPPPAKVALLLLFQRHRP